RGACGPVPGAHRQGDAVINMAVARRYAKAILEIGEEQQNLDGLVDEIVRASEAYEASKDLRNALENPLVSHDAKRAVLNEVADRIGDTVIDGSLRARLQEMKSALLSL